MLQSGVFRTGLLATALVTAIAVPACATPTPAAPEAGTVVVKKSKQGRQAAAVPQAYKMKADLEASMSAQATGTIEWNDTSFQVRNATIKDFGAGRATITYSLTGAAGVTPQNKEFSTETAKATNFSISNVKGLKSLTITVCKTVTDPANGNLRGVCRLQTFDPKSTDFVKASKKAAKPVAKKAAKPVAKKAAKPAGKPVAKKADMRAVEKAARQR